MRVGEAATAPRVVTPALVHPLIARFLHFETVRDLLKRKQEGATLTGDEALYARAADAFPEPRDSLLALEEKDVSGEVQEGEVEEIDFAHDSGPEDSLLLLAAHTARLSLDEDPELAPAVARAREALAAQGATEEQMNELIASILLEEGFGYADPADDFDREFVKATLAEVPHLASLSPERVEALERKFVEQGGPKDVRAKVMSSLLGEAWADGPSPINPEHLELAWSAISRTVRSKSGERERVKFLVEALETLAKKGYVSDLRLTRLKGILAELSGLDVEGARG